MIERRWVPQHEGGDDGECTVCGAEYTTMSTVIWKAGGEHAKKQ